MDDNLSLFVPKHPGYVLKKRMIEEELTETTLSIALEYPIMSLRSLLSEQDRVSLTLSVKVLHIWSDINLSKLQIEYDKFFIQRETKKKYSNRDRTFSAWDLLRKRGGLPDEEFKDD